MNKSVKWTGQTGKFVLQGLFVALWLLTPLVALAHRPGVPLELAQPLLEGHVSGPYKMNVVQYVTAGFTQVELELADFESLPHVLNVSVQAVSAETAHAVTLPMQLFGKHYVATLPELGEDWHVSVQVASEIGAGSAEVTVIPYREPVETPLAIRIMTFVGPALLVATLAVGFKLSGVSLVQAQSLIPPADAVC